ncbi:mobile element protein [Streptomyces sp. NPDC058268]|uniref:mobile element protein n=1 Tax=Streptomyces sp. NPDC058268 TaxID=3346413 RepID=UPI0036E857EA
MATTDYLADPADLAIWLGVPDTDPKLLQALGAASSRFRGQVRHHVSLVTDDEFTLDGTGTRSILLPAQPVTAVASLRLEGAELVDGTDFEWSQDGYVRRLGCGLWPNKLRCIQGVYSHGYAVIPEDIAEAVIDQARSQYIVRPGVATMQVGGQQVGFGAQASIGVTAQWSAAVEKYRLNRGDRT